MRLAFLSIGRHIHTERWIRWFAERGHECHLLTVQPGPVPGVTVHDISSAVGPKPWRYLLSLRKVRRLLAELGPDLLNTHFLTGYGYWGHFSRFQPNVLTVWGDDVYVTPFESRLKLRLAGAALASCAALTGDSADILDRAGQLGADPERSYRVLWGVDFARFRPHDAAAWRRERGFGDDEILFFSPRSYTQPYYNIDTVIAAAVRVQEAEPRARFLFSGYEGDPEPFRRMADLAGIAGRSTLLGRLPHDEFATALAASDVFISVPSVDATAVSLLEAMATGGAVIVSSLPSSCEWVRDGESGLVVPPRDAAALAAAMLRFAAEPQRRRAYGRAALAVARRHAGFDTNMEAVDALFRHCLDPASPPPRAVSLAQLRRQAEGCPR
ncbi:MAG: glycosyltransferase [Krumholzibacteria bacterium]|nr:glycosyltransferase [Candidatus Krumholzibacteria bacterium]